MRAARPAMDTQNSVSSPSSGERSDGPYLYRPAVQPAYDMYGRPSPPSPLSQPSPPEGTLTLSSPSPLSPSAGGYALPEQDIGDIYWAARHVDPSQYTFYREGTPTPPDYRSEHEKAVASAGDYVPDFPAAEATYAGGAYPAKREFGADEPEPETWRPPRTTICGLSIVTFRCLVTIFVFVVVAIAIGLGIGLSLGRTGGYPLPTYPGSPGPPTDIPPSPTPGAPAPGPTPTVNPYTECPSVVNNTLYAVPGTTKRFRRLCSIDFGGFDEAIDLSHVATANMTECMARCAAFVTCTGCGWGFIEGDQGREHRCWLKSGLQKSHAARADWQFAVLEE